MQHESCHSHEESHCHPQKGRPDYILWGSLAIILAAFAVWGLTSFAGLQIWAPLVHGSHTVVDLMKKMLWGLVFGILFVGVLDFVPRSKFHQVLGKSGGLNGIWRATLAGVLLDLCSHGILLVGMKLYERGASIGQVVAFLVASPWNSFSMTLILWSLVGFKLTLAFILLSCVIAIVSGMLFESFERKGVLPKNPHAETHASGKKEPWFEFPKDKGPIGILMMSLQSSVSESKMILRWIFFGVILTAVVKVLFSPETFQSYFGPDTMGVLLTLASATVLEVCSEGSAPLASEFVTTAHAPGNAFTFLMAGVSTDYTEIMSLKETTKSWKIAFFLPLVTLPQVILLGLLLNWVRL